MDIVELSTPALLINWDQVEANCQMMSARAKMLGVRLRPHVKTHKCIEIARLSAGPRPFWRHHSLDDGGSQNLCSSRFR